MSFIRTLFLSISFILGSVTTSQAMQLSFKVNQESIIDKPDNNGSTPLHLVARNGNSAMAERFLACGANKTLKTKAGQTAYDIALQYHPNNYQLLNLLKLS